MKVFSPVNPETAVPTRQLGYVKNVQQPNFDLVAAAAKSFSVYLEDEEKKKEEFNISRAVIDESNALITDFETRTKAAPLGATKFSEETNSAYTQRHQALLQSYKEQGYSRIALEALDIKLSGLRQGMLVRSIAFQTQSQQALAGKELDHYQLGASQHASANPLAIDSIIAEADGAISSRTDITEVDKQKYKDSIIQSITSSAGNSYAHTNYETVIRLLDPKGFEEANAPEVVAPAADSWQGVASSIATEFGLPAEQVAAVMSYETAGTFDPKIMGGKGGKYMGLIQFGPEERKKYGIDKDSTPAEWTAAISGFMQDRGFKPGMSLLDFYSTINAGSPGRYNASDGNGTVSTHLNKILAEHLEKGKRWLQVGSLATRLEGGTQTEQIIPAPSMRKTEGEVQPTVAPTYNLTGKTGDPVLDRLDGNQRMQVLSIAQAQANRGKAEARASLEVQHSNAVTAFLATGEFAGTMPVVEQYVALLGETAGKQKFAELTEAQQVGQAAKGFKTQPADVIAAGLEALRPKDTSSPNYAIELEYFNRAQTAAQQVMKQREDDPNTYVMANFPAVATAIGQAQTVEQRRDAYIELNQTYEALGVPQNQRFPYSKEQLIQISEKYKGLNAGSRLDVLLSLQKEFDTTGLYGPLVAQMDKHGASLTNDTVMWGMLYRSPEGRSVMLDYLNGKDRIKEDAALRPSPESVNRGFAGDASGLGQSVLALNGRYSQLINDATAAIYVINGGRVDMGKVNQVEYKEALRLAVGGMKSNLNTGFYTDSHSVATILPSTITKQEFENWKDRISLGDLIYNSTEPTRYPLDKFGNKLTAQDLLEEGSFVMFTPGNYGIKLSKDGGYAKTSTGKTFTVRITPETIRGR